MSQRYQFPSGELAHTLVLPPDIQRRLALASIGPANIPVNCHIAQATAHNVCLGLDIGQVLTRAVIDRMEILFDNVANQRLAEMVSDAQP